QGGAQGALARAGGRRQDECAAIALQYSAVEREELVCMRVDAPVHAPLQQRESLIARQGLKWHYAIHVEDRLRSDDSPNVRRLAHANVKVRKTTRFSQRELVVESQ